MPKAILFDCIGVLYILGGLNQELLDFSQSLRPRYKVGLLTNLSAESLHKYFTQDQRKKYFDTLVVADDAGFIKPATAIYTYVAKGMGLDPNQCVLIDDSQINCDGAVKAGMQAILYQSTQQTKQELALLLE